MTKPFNILFLFTGNSCRSQMAEGWAWWFGGPLAEVQAAGIEAHSENPRATVAMEEAGLDISNQASTQVTDVMLEHAALVVTVCGHADEHWPLQAPVKATGSDDKIMDIFRGTRDDNKQRVQELLQKYI
ncbi:MAG: arsenate reductase ArsC [Gammaproteobacteria bacterium]|nr:arsenate reductase ArsC [Gammaproteobacteria bacterium]